MSKRRPPATPPAKPPPEPAAAPSPAPSATATAEPLGDAGEPRASVCEVLALPAGMLAQLPLGTTLRLRTRGVGGWLATTCQRAYADARAAGDVALTGAELTALAVAAERQRATLHDLAAWLARKGGDPAWRLDLGVALGGVAGEPPPDAPWPLGRVLSWYATALTDVLVTLDSGEVTQL